MPSRDDHAVWHPILSAVESPPGVWTLTYEVGDKREPEAVVRIIRIGDEVGYKGELVDGTVVGYWTTLLTATAETHAAWLRTLGRHEPPATVRK